MFIFCINCYICLHIAYLGFLTLRFLDRNVDESSLFQAAQIFGESKRMLHLIFTLLPFVIEILCKYTKS